MRDGKKHRHPGWHSPEDMPLGMLINGLSKFFGERQRTMGEKIGIRDNFRPVLYHLRHEGGLSQYELAMRCQVKPSSMSVTLRNMEEQGYICRKADEKDQRLIRVYLTDAGIALDDRLIGLIHETEALFVNALREEETIMLKKLLAKIYRVTIGKEEATHEEIG